MDRETAMAATVPIVGLLCFAALEAVASRPGCLTVTIVGGLGFLTFAIWKAWPEDTDAEELDIVNVRIYLNQHPDERCPVCHFPPGHHLSRCPVTGRGNR